MTDCARSSGRPRALGGAGKWRAAHTAALVAATVTQAIIIPDTDTAGREHAQTVAARCHAAGIAVKVVTLPDPHKDVSEYFEDGGDVAKLTALCKAAPRWSPADRHRPTTQICLWPGSNPSASSRPSKPNG